MAEDVRDELVRLVVTCAVYDRARRFLLLHRRPDLPVYPGKWSVPGGGKKKSDGDVVPGSIRVRRNSVENAVRREIREEAGIEVGSLQYAGSGDFERPDKIWVTFLRFTALYEGDPADVRIDPEDAVAYTWASPVEFGNFDLIEDMAEELRSIARTI